MGLGCIKGARGSYAADIFLVAWCICKLNLGFLTIFWRTSRYEGYECAVGEIGVEGWGDILVRLCDLVC